MPGTSLGYRSLSCLRRIFPCSFIHGQSEIAQRACSFSRPTTCRPICSSRHRLTISICRSALHERQGLDLDVNKSLILALQYSTNSDSGDDSVSTLMKNTNRMLSENPQAWCEEFPQDRKLESVGLSQDAISKKLILDRRGPRRSTSVSEQLQEDVMDPEVEQLLSSCEDYHYDDYEYHRPNAQDEFGPDDDEEGVILQESRPTGISQPETSLERGTHGVFDVEDMVRLLESVNGENISVIDVPPEAQFVDQMIVVSAKSLRHMRAIASSIEWLYKKKKAKRDRDFKLEGKDSKDWFAMDLGNIAVHIFMPDAREHYDIDNLWTLGPEEDSVQENSQHGSGSITELELNLLENLHLCDDNNPALKETSEVKAGNRTDDIQQL